MDVGARGREAQKYVWEGAIPLQIHLHESEVTTLPHPSPALVTPLSFSLSVIPLQYLSIFQSIFKKILFFLQIEDKFFKNLKHIIDLLILNLNRLSIRTDY